MLVLVVRHPMKYIFLIGLREEFGGEQLGLIVP